MPKIGVVDYGIGNLLSVTRALAHVGAEPVLVNDGAGVAGVSALILPGVGAFGAGMASLVARGLIQPLRDYAASGRAFLGICLGTQLMMQVSEEFGNHQGLGLVAGTVSPVPACGLHGHPHRIPHIGWADLRESVPGRWKGTILEDLGDKPSVYFVHSFHAQVSDPGDELARVDYDGIPVTAAIHKGNLIGCQFHPEKSGDVGLSILERFVRDAA